MTRINFGIPPEKLTDQHLLAEIRELPRIPRAVKKRLDEGEEVKTIYGPFRLGPGHVTWFNDKLRYLRDRYYSLVREARRRRFHLNCDMTLFEDLKKTKYYGGQYPTVHDIQLITDRISQRIRESNQIPRFYREPIDKEEYINSILTPFIAHIKKENFLIM